MKKVVNLSFCFLFFASVFAQEQKLSDNLPGKYLALDSDTSIIAYRVSSGYFGDFDVILDAFNKTDNSYVKSWYVGTSGRDFHADILISNNNYFFTGYSNLLSGFGDDILVARVSYDESKSWAKILQGNIGDKGNRIIQENDSIIVLANSNSFTSNQSLIITVFSEEGNLLTQLGYDFDATFFPTNLVYNSDYYFVSGYTTSGVASEGVILKISKADYSVVWARKFENSFSSEVQQLYLSETGVYFSGWSGDGSYKALLVGEMDLDGQLIWKRTASHRGLSSVVDIKKQSNNLFLSGFIRTLEGNEENEFLAKIDVNSKDIKIYSIDQANRTFSSGEILFRNDSVYLSSFQILANLSHKGVNSFWEESNNGCFAVHQIDSITNQSYLKIANQNATKFIPSLTEVLGCEIIEHMSAFSEIDNCIPNPTVVSVIENKNDCNNIRLVYEEANVLIINNCTSVIIEQIKVFSSLGKELYYNDKGEIPVSVFELQSLYFIEIVYQNKTSEILEKRTIKFFKP
jgi:hypothetical protein